MTGTSAPHAVRTLAHERRAARLARDWATADRLKTEIEAAGWRVVDRGADFALQPAIPPDAEVDGVVLHGAPEAVESLLELPAAPGLTVCAVGGTSAVPADVVALAGPEPVDAPGAAVVRLASDALVGSLVDVAVRRVGTEWLLLVPAGTEDPDAAPLAATALAAAVETLGGDPSIVALGLVGARTPDLHTFVPVRDGDADVLLAGPVAVRRADLAALLPLERRIVSADRFFQWLSLALRRDTGPEDAAPRRVVVVAGAGDALVARRCAAASDDHVAKRDFYRILDRFGPDPSLLTVR